MSDSLDESQRDRYSRSLMLEFIGDLTQQTFLESRVLVAGAGGLGWAIIQSLAAAGVGTIGIVDDGAVKGSNFQRQVIHGVDDVGEPKVESAARAVDILNPDVAVEQHRTRIDSDVDESLLEDYDVVVDGLDNFAGRLVLNDVTALSDIPIIHGAVFLVWKARPQCSSPTVHVIDVSSQKCRSQAPSALTNRWEFYRRGPE